MQQLHNFFTLGRVQVTGRLISNNNFGITGQRSGNGHPLSLPTRQLAGFVLEPVAQPDGRQAILSPGFTVFILHPRKNQWQHNVFERRIGALQVKGLKNKANILIAVGRQLTVTGAGQLVTVDYDGAAIRMIQAANDVGQSGLTRARRPGDGDKFTGVNFKRNAIQGVQGFVAEMIGFGNVFEFDNRVHANAFSKHSERFAKIQAAMLFGSYKSLKDLLRSPLVWLSLVAALLYSSWPWSFLLDPSVAHHSLASELEAPHRPYNWLFIAMDVLTGLVLVGIGAWQFRKRLHSHRGVIFGYVLFGLLVIIAAATPLVCDPTTQACGPLAHSYRILIHGAASIGSVVFLFFALLGVTRKVYQQHGTSLLCIGLTTLLLGWLFFAIGSVSEQIWHTHRGNLMQDFFISLCSLSVMAVVVAIEHHHLLQQPD